MIVSDYLAVDFESQCERPSGIIAALPIQIAFALPIFNLLKTEVLRIPLG
jgi:hypothetical protein